MAEPDRLGACDCGSIGELFVSNSADEFDGTLVVEDWRSILKGSLKSIPVIVAETCCSRRGALESRDCDSGLASRFFPSGDVDRRAPLSVFFLLMDDPASVPECCKRKGLGEPVVASDSFERAERHRQSVARYAIGGYQMIIYICSYRDEFRHRGTKRNLLDLTSGISGLKSAATREAGLYFIM